MPDSKKGESEQTYLGDHVVLEPGVLVDAVGVGFHGLKLHQNIGNVGSEGWRVALRGTFAEVDPGHVEELLPSVGRHLGFSYKHAH